MGLQPGLSDTIEFIRCGSWTVRPVNRLYMLNIPMECYAVANRPDRRAICLEIECDFAKQIDLSDPRWLFNAQSHANRNEHDPREAE